MGDHGYALALVGCTKRKRDHPAAARHLYDRSPLFRRRRRLARRVAGAWAVLSAEHGLVTPGQRLAPYDTHISQRDPDTWQQDVLADLQPRVAAGETVLVLAGGRDYVDPIRDALDRLGVTVDAPLRSEPPGRQFAILDDRLAHTTQQTLGEVTG